MEGSLTFRASAILGKRIYDPQDWSLFRAVVDAQNQFSEQNVVLGL
jgi:hypothetical protein